MNTGWFWNCALERLNRGHPLFVAVVVANTRGSPGTVGAHLLVDVNGETAGTIGGGIMEAKLVEAVVAGAPARRNYVPELQRLVHRKVAGTPYQSGLICAGEQTNLNVWLDPARDLGTIRQFCRAIGDQDGDGLILEVSTDGLRTREGVVGSPCGSEVIVEANGWVYRESSLNARRLAIVGGGHCGKALAHLAVIVGYSVDVFDTRAGVLQSSELLAGARCHVLRTYADLESHLRHVERTVVVVMTSSVDEDVSALTSIAECNLRWLGVMGSRAKIHEIHQRLTTRGIGQPSIDRIHGPIGLKMKSDTPPEIAVSIMGELLAAQAPATYQTFSGLSGSLEAFDLPPSCRTSC